MIVYKIGEQNCGGGCLNIFRTFPDIVSVRNCGHGADERLVRKSAAGLSQDMRSRCKDLICLGYFP
jgi:hypothetical protein